MHQFWFSIGSFPIRAYGTVLILAFILSVGVAVFLAKVQKKEEYIPHILDIAPLVLIGGLVGARFWQVFFFDWAYYSRNPEEILAVWHGGLAIQGGIIGALITGFIYVKMNKLSFWEFADLAAPAIILGQSIGRDANLLNGDAFGAPTGGNFGIVYPPETIAAQTYGTQPLWPAEVWEGQIDIIIFAVLLILQIKRWTPGFIFLAYLIFYNFSRIFLEYLRGDSIRYLFDWTAAQWSSAVTITIAVLMIVFLKIRENRNYG